jgi:FdrA protein
MAPAVRTLILPNAYRDSVELMRIAAEVERLPGVVRAGIMMATEANLAVLADAGLLDRTGSAPRPNDLIAAVAAEDDAAATTALDQAERLLAGPVRDRPSEHHTEAATTLHEALAEIPAANLVLISTPGTYATAEALKAIKRGLNVFLFSDNVSLADEIELKRLAERKGLLVMGPDCGTAILDGVPLGFANVVRRGRIGLIGASGTGLQQVSCLIDRLGEGVSQAIGVGGRDFHEQVGGRTALAALRRLASDEGTSVIVLISKPPAPAVAERVLAAAAACAKPVVVNFLGQEGAGIRAFGAIPAFTFEEAALLAVGLVRGAPKAELSHTGLNRQREEPTEAPGLHLAPGQDAIRGLYCGGSLAGEAKLVLRRVLGDRRAARHTIIDLGDDEYTVGRPHPMIDPRLRNQYVVDAARDPQVALILLDVVLGYNAHPDPAGALVPALGEARQEAARAGRQVTIVATVCGTPADPQDLDRQEASLAAAGVLLAPSNAQAAKLAARLVDGSAAGAAAPAPAGKDSSRSGRKREVPGDTPAGGS